MWFSVITSLIAVVAGLLLASSGGYNAALLEIHKLLGLATVFVSVWLLVIRLWIEKKATSKIWIYQALLFVNVVLLSFAGHYGGSLTHGATYLTKNMPSALKNLLGVETVTYEKISKTIVNDTLHQVPEKTVFFLEKIQPILEENCYKCHNESKQKGDFRLDNLDWDIINGLDSKHWDDVLYEVSEGNMPPEEKEPLSKQDKEILLGWIEKSLQEKNKTELVASNDKEAPINVIKEASVSKNKKSKNLAIASKTGKKLSKEESYYKNKVAPLLATYCYGCHGPKRQKGNMRLDVLDWNMISGSDGEKWHLALNEINSGEMPPKKKAQPSQSERRLIVDWMTNSLAKSTAIKKGKIKNVIKRLTKSQYTHSLNELLELPINFGNILPDDGKSKMGFSNNAEVLQISPLHIDYYQKIARQALDKAIIYGHKPEPKRYKVTIGKNIGKGLPGAMYGGYQAFPISNNDFKVDILNSDGSLKLGLTELEQEELDNVKGNIGLGMRGSMSDRFAILKDGMLLYSALPHLDVPPRSWQGPSPNLKLLVKKDFPQYGNLVFRVEASKGKPLARSEGLISLRNNKPLPKTAETIVIKVESFKRLKNMKVTEDGRLSSLNVAKDANSQSSFEVKKDGFYQVDLEHPYASNVDMPSYKIQIGKFSNIQERLHLDPSLESSNEIVTPVTLAYLRKGKYKIKVGGKFFVGCSKILINEIPETDPLPYQLEKEIDENLLKYKDVNPAIRVFAGSRTDDGMDYANFDASKEVVSPVGEFQKFEFFGHLENLPKPELDLNDRTENSNTLIVGLWNNYLVKNKRETGPPVLIKSIEIEAPYNPVWPPKSHTKIFFDSPNKDIKDVYAVEVIKRFMENAYRRKVSNTELKRYVDFWKETKNDYDRFEDSVKEVMVAILCSPSFLFMIDEKPKDVKSEKTDFFMASKMSYFLWNSPPDAELNTIAAKGELKEQVSAQIDRMVEDPKIWRMIRSFSYEWLRMDRLNSMDINKRMYTDYTRFVKEDMAEETYNFMHYVLDENKSIFNFIDSDFAMLNQNLAEFYGVENVIGDKFRPVAIKPEEHRGGLLSQGAFLTGHSDGEGAHPIKRAVWLKEKILGDSPPPPPPNVPEIDPDTPGFDKLTLKEKLELHRNKASCIDCHLKIDPYGVVFENFDAVGRFQLTAKGKPIDSKSTLPDGTNIEGVEGIKIIYFK